MSALERRGGVARRRRDALDDRLEDGRRRSVPSLADTMTHLLARHREDVLELLDDHLGLRRGQVDLVEDRDDDEPLREREVDVRDRLRFDALRRVDDEQRALAGLAGCD